MHIPYVTHHIWSGKQFAKDEWGEINYFLGPNGTRKTMVAEELRGAAQNAGLKARYVSADRLAGVERYTYSSFSPTPRKEGYNIYEAPQQINSAATSGLTGDCFLKLKTRDELRIKVASTLSQLFNRKIIFEDRGGFLVPLITHRDLKYNVRSHECHGLKELIGLLTLLYDTEHNCLIIDEPELHLHPQLQSFLLREIRKEAGDPTQGKKIFFLITHSPFMLDIRSIEELESCLFFRQDEVPTYALVSDPEDRYRLSRMLPRLSAHQKQFFFASAPVMVEGYTDEEIMLLIQEKRGAMLRTSDCLIRAGGKDEIEIFFRLAKLINKPAKFIVDLDAIQTGKIAGTISMDARYLSAIAANGIAVTHALAVDPLWKAVDDCIMALEQAASRTVQQLEKLSHALKTAKDAHMKRRLFIVALFYQGPDISIVLSTKSSTLSFIEKRLQDLCEAWQQCDVMPLIRGALENYLPSNQTSYRPSDSDKQECFITEREYLLSTNLSETDLLKRYGQLLDVLDWAFLPDVVDFSQELNTTVAEWIHGIQMAVRSGFVTDEQTLIDYTPLNFGLSHALFSLQSFETSKNGFVCRIKFEADVDSFQREYIFDETVVPSQFDINVIPRPDIAFDGLYAS